MASEWFYTRDGKSKSGPVSSAQLQALAKSGKLQPTDKVWKEGMAKWVPASTIKGLFNPAAAAVTAKKPVATTAKNPDKGRSDARPASRKSRASDDQPEESRERTGRGKTVALVALATVACVACLGGIAIAVAVYMNSGTLDNTLAEKNGRDTPIAALDAKGKKAEAPEDQPQDKAKGEQPQGKGTDKKEPSTEQPKDKEKGEPAEKTEPSSEPKDKTTEKKEPPKELTKEQPKDKTKEEPGPTPPKVDLPDFSNVDYTYDFSKLDYTKGPDGQKLVERSGEEKTRPGEEAKTSPKEKATPLIRFVEQGFVVDKPATPDDITDTYRRLLPTLVKRNSRAAEMHQKQVTELLAKGEVAKLPLLPSTSLRPAIDDFRFTSKVSVKVEEVVIDKPQKAIVWDGKVKFSGDVVQPAPVGDLFALDSREVRFKPILGNLAILKASEVMAVMTTTDTYFYSRDKKQFVSINELAPSGKQVVKWTKPEQTKARSVADLLFNSGVLVRGELLYIDSKQVQFQPDGKRVGNKIVPGQPIAIDASNIRAIRRSPTTYFYCLKHKYFVSLNSLNDLLNGVREAEELAAVWLELRQGKMPATFEFLAKGKPADINKSFVQHGRSKGEYVLDNEVRPAYESYYCNGKAHGPQTRYYPNDKKMFEGVWVNGKLHGVSKDYYDTGELLAEYRLVHGQQHGIQKKFHTNGKVNYEGIYVNGKEVGWHKGWFEDGRVKYETLYENGVPLVWYYTMSGKKHGPMSSTQFQTIAKSGKLEGVATRWHIKGGKGEEGTFKAGEKDGKWTFWYSNGVKSEEGSFQADKKIGFWSRWFLDGKKAEEQTYLNGVLHGGEIHYNRYKDGHIVLTCQWVNGQRHGKEVSYSQFTGRVEWEGHWVNGEKHGVWSFYDNLGGNLVERKVLYVNGIEQR